MKFLGVKAICGNPGAGKTFLATYEALQTFKNDNTLIKRIVRKILKRPIIENLIYSNYPILLDKKKKIYSNIVLQDDLDNSVSFPDNSFIVITEPQLDYDSLDYKIFPRVIGNFFQAHRHFSIRSIILDTQHPNRLVMYEKNVMTRYDRITHKFDIPFIHLTLITFRYTYELVNYDFILTPNKDIKKLNDIRGGFKFINNKNVIYNSKFLAPINNTKPRISRGSYTGLELPNFILNEYKKKFSRNK